MCLNCGYEDKYYHPICPNCGAEDSMVPLSEVRGESEGKVPAVEVYEPGVSSKPDRVGRISTGFRQLDHILGGGWFPGSLVFLAGAPGVGKSSLALEFLGSFKSPLYVSGEETRHQVFARADRLGVRVPFSFVHAESFDQIEKAVRSGNYDFLVIDSLQVMGISSSVGYASAHEARRFTHALMDLTKEVGVTTLLLGHVTKEGAIAGPKTVEHLVDVIIHINYTDIPGIRVMSVGKNRFGPAGGVMFWSMGDAGLEPVSSGWEVKGGIAGRSYGVGISGNVIQLVEINALVVKSYGEKPKRMVTGYPFDRFMMLLAILEKYLHLKFYDKDVFVEVGRGFVWRDYALDLPVAAALVSAYFGEPLRDDRLVSSQELTLLGTARVPVSYEIRKNTAVSVGWNLADLITSVREVREWLREE